MKPTPPKQDKPMTTTARDSVCPDCGNIIDHNWGHLCKSPNNQAAQWRKEIRRILFELVATNGKLTTVAGAAQQIEALLQEVQAETDIDSRVDELEKVAKLMPRKHGEDSKHDVIAIGRIEITDRIATLTNKRRK